MTVHAGVAALMPLCVGLSIRITVVSSRSFVSDESTSDTFDCNAADGCADARYAFDAL
jgi:hypothetical protein